MTSSYYILCLETSTPCCSVALSSDNGCLASLSYEITHAHTQLLPQILSHLLDSCALKRNQLSAVAISEGPGSYTGLRIGAATAKALCYALHIPLIATSPLRLMAEELSKYLSSPALILPLLPQKGSTYAYALYNSSLEPLISPEMGTLSPELLTQIASSHPLYVLTPSVQLPEAITDRLHAHQLLLHLPSRPSATQICDYASSSYLKKAFTSAEEFQPLYPVQKSYRRCISSL